MPIDAQSGKLTVRTRDQVRDRWLRDYLFRVPDADTGVNSQPYIDGTLVANVVAPIYSNANNLANATTWLTARGEELTDWAAQLGRSRRPATGAIGYVIIEAATGGGSILAGTELRHVAKGMRYQVIVGGVYQNGDLCAVEGIDTGLGTNLEAGETLKWLSPPAGILSTCLVFENSDGSGLSGGSPEETDEELLDALIDLHANPPASGNDAEVASFIMSLQGIAVQRAFVYPCIEGPGEYAVAFTMRPDRVGGSRIPNGAQIAKVDAELRAKFPADDGIFVASILSQRFTPCIRVRWVDNVNGFVDVKPWPAYASPKVIVDSSPLPTVSSARLKFCTDPPPVGATVAFYDPVTRTFRRKRIATVSAMISPDNKYDVTFNMAANASDPTFVPLLGAVVSPYAEAMNELVEPVLAYVGKQGVGEMVSAFPDPGKRQRRIPFPRPNSWPHTVTSAILDDIYELVDDADLAEPATPFATTLGTPPLLVYLHVVGDIGIYQK